MIELKCECCGSPFTAVSLKWAGRRRRYCSTKCNLKVQAQRMGKRKKAADEQETPVPFRDENFDRIDALIAAGWGDVPQNRIEEEARANGGALPGPERLAEITAEIWREYCANGITRMKILTAEEEEARRSRISAALRGKARRPKTKVTIEIVREIRAVRGELTPSQAGARFGLAKSTIHKIWANKLWRNAV